MCGLSSIFSKRKNIFESFLNHLRIVYIDGQWRTAELTKKECQAITALGVDIT